MIGELPENILNSILETIPAEFSVLDADDRVLAWNKHETRIFKRPETVIGRNVRDCHPRKSLHKVRTPDLSQLRFYYQNALSSYGFVN